MFLVDASCVSLCVIYFTIHSLYVWLVSHCVGQQGGNGSAPGQQTEQPQQEDEDDEEEEGTEGQI